MDGLSVLALIMRWLHILAASLAIGVPLYVRFVLQPAASHNLDETRLARLRDGINRLWQPLVYVTIVLFLISGLYNFIFVILPWDLGAYKATYHALFGFKMILALVAFFLASALPGRTRALEPIRRRGRLWLTVLVLVMLVILMMSNTLRAMRDATAKEAMDAASTRTPVATMPR